MSRLKAERLTLGLGAQRIALLGESTRLVLEQAPDAAGFAALQAALAQPARKTWFAPRLQVCVADSLLRYWLVQPPANVASLAVLQAVAEARFSQLFGSTPAGWRLRADWQLDQPFVACALPEALCQNVQALVQQQGWRLDGIAPAALSALNRVAGQIPDDGWLGIAHGLDLLYGLRLAGQWHSLRLIRFDAAPSADVLLERLQGEARRLAVAGDSLPSSWLWLGEAGWLPRGERFGNWRSQRLGQGAAPALALQLALGASA